MAEEIEKIYVIPLKKKGFKSSRSAPTAVKRVKSYLTKHMKVEEENIWIDDSLNNSIWEKGKYNMASKIRVKAVKFEDGVVEAYLPEFEFKKSRRELLKEEREKKEPILKKEEAVAEGETGEVSGAEDYDLLISDINMPQLNGLDLATTLKQSAAFKNKPILILTTESSAEMKAKGKEIGVTGWLVKPFSDEKLVKAIKMVLGI